MTRSKDLAVIDRNRQWAKVTSLVWWLGTVTRYRPDDRVVVIRFPAGEKILLLLRMAKLVLGPTQQPIQSVRADFRWG